MCCQDNMEPQAFSRNYIIESVRQIDRMQKEIIIDNASSCITCETSLITRSFNTVPVAFFTNTGSFFNAILTSLTPTSTTNLFRIECLRDNRFVTLQLLSLTDGVLTATGQTCILDLDCVCGIECFEPINVEEC